ncbi:MAG: hypothetical protein DMG89_13790 [Acidobacteria bacterium]|nr:MAG: hypothetical protein DMG89_13790 [Acidobacteriota bacterium]
MVKKLFTLLCGSLVAFSLSTVIFAQEAPTQEKKMDKVAKEARWEGEVVRGSPDKSTLTVRKSGSNLERTVHYDSSTKWVSQEHGSNKDGDRVIVRGTWDKDELHATLISKRLSHSK